MERLKHLSAYAQKASFELYDFTRGQPVDFVAATELATSLEQYRGDAAIAPHLQRVLTESHDETGPLVPLEQRVQSLVERLSNPQRLSLPEAQLLSGQLLRLSDAALRRSRSPQY